MHLLKGVRILKLQKNRNRKQNSITRKLENASIERCQKLRIYIDIYCRKIEVEIQLKNKKFRTRNKHLFMQD